MDSQDCNLPLNQSASSTDSLFERCHWLYALCREHLFRDQTLEMRKALFPPGDVPPGTSLLELGCGPGHYACRFAAENPALEATGIDLSHNLLRWAESRASELHLENCHFQSGDAQALSAASDSVDAVIVSRLFLIVPNKEAVLSEVHRVLKPGGRCFFAEPTSSFTTRLPLIAMRFLSRLMPGPFARSREPEQAEVMCRDEFTRLIASQPWASVEMRYDNWYQSAVCVKSDVAAVGKAVAA